MLIAEMYIALLGKLIFIQLFTFNQANNKCSELPKIPKYHLIEKCHRSKLSIAARANYESLTSCYRLGIEKKALALNFSPKQTWNGSVPEYSCEVLKCAESHGGMWLSNDSSFDYYSLYAKPIPNVNTTCVPATGMFYLLNNQINYTQAQNKCKNMSGVLADITTEQRTDGLAQVLSNAGVTAAYVGLTRINSVTFHSTNGNALECTTYRAWAPGHPRRNPNYSCVVLTQQHTWKSTKCKNKLPSLCELIPNGPYKRGSIFADIGNETRTLNGIP